jgi:hypothetical protein
LGRPVATDCHRLLLMAMHGPLLPPMAPISPDLPNLMAMHGPLLPPMAPNGHTFSPNLASSYLP